MVARVSRIPLVQRRWHRTVQHCNVVQYSQSGQVGPPRKIGKTLTFFRFFRPTQKFAWDGPKCGREVFFRLIQTLPTFWATWILILRIFVDLLDPRPRPGLGRTWAGRRTVRGTSTTRPRHLWTTKLVRSEELGQYRENPISASPVRGICRTKNLKKRNLKIKICVAQNVGQVWISRKQNLLIFLGGRGGRG